MARRLVTLLVVASVAGLVLVAAGCGGDDKSSATDTTTTATTPVTEETETTATETEETETETTETTETSATPDFASSENCQEFAQIGAKISSALTGTSDIGDVQQAFDELAAAAPSEIKADFETLADYFGAVADAVGDVSAGQTPSPEALAKLQGLDSAAATQASQNIATWAQENCGGVTP